MASHAPLICTTCHAQPPWAADMHVRKQAVQWRMVSAQLLTAITLSRAFDTRPTLPNKLMSFLTEPSLETSDLRSSTK